MGPDSEVIEVPSVEYYRNCHLVPASKMYNLAWADKQYKVGQIICEAFRSDDSPIAAQPRKVAKQQLMRLESAGYRLYSAFEIEFFVVDAQTTKPVYDNIQKHADLALSKNARWIYDIENHLRKLDINIEYLHTEDAAGQFEFCMKPKYGLDVFDDLFVMKEAMKEILAQHGVKPTFMSRPFENCTSAFHFNHSLWNSDGKNVFYDESMALNMSDTFRYWMGGLIKHTNSLAALCNPTPNCFRRFHEHLAPSGADWGIDDRRITFRVKNIGAGGSYVENRLPSSACNPYIVVAATIAAGLDGIENKIEPPKLGKQQSSPKIGSYSECLDDLKNNTVLNNALGKEFLDWWLAIKQHENVRFGSSSHETMSKDIEAERKFYFDMI